MALAILSLTLLSSSAVALRAFQLSQTSAQRSTMAFAAQAQMEAVRTFRDNHTWIQFLHGNSGPSYPGVLSAATGGCKVLAQCFHMDLSSGSPVPVAGFVTETLPGSYIEIMATPEPGPTPNLVKFEAAWGFDSVGSGPPNQDTILTELVNLKATPVAVAAPTGPSPLCTIQPPTLIVNGNFNDDDAGPGPGVSAAARFTSDLPNRGDNLYPDDAGANGSVHYAGGFSIQHGTVDYDDGSVHLHADPFPGDPSRQVAASPAFFYSNPNESLVGVPGPFSGTLWRENVTGLSPNTNYYFVTYFYNLLPLDDPTAADPKITLLINGASPSGVTVVPKGSGWMPVETQFTTGPTQNSLQLSITDTANDIHGDDFGMAAASLYVCD